MATDGRVKLEQDIERWFAEEMVKIEQEMKKAWGKYQLCLRNIIVLDEDVEYGYKKVHALLLKAMQPMIEDVGWQWDPKFGRITLVWCC